jgi:hypothetical protein
MTIYLDISAFKSVSIKKVAVRHSRRIKNFPIQMGSDWFPHFGLAGLHVDTSGRNQHPKKSSISTSKSLEL